MVESLLMGIVPSIWSILAFDYRRNGRHDSEQRWRLAVFGIIAVLIMLLFAFKLGGPLVEPMRLLSVMGMALSPATSGLLAIYLQRWLSTVPTRSIRVRIGTVAFAFAILGVAGIAAGILPFPLYIFLTALFIAMVWQLWIWAIRWWPVLYFAELFLLLIVVAATNQHTTFFPGPPWVRGLAAMVICFLAPAAAVIMAACLSLETFRDQSWSILRRRSPALLLALVLLLLVLYQIFLAGVWDVATDGLSSLMLTLVIGLTATAVAVPMAFSLNGRRRWISLAFPILVLFTMAQVQEIANHAPTGEWGMMPGVLTEQRAQILDNAIRAYKSDHGRYPDALPDLVPWNLVYIPPPMIVPGQTWCYQGDADSYRLGYKYRDYFSSPLATKIHSAAGDFPATAICP